MSSAALQRGSFLATPRTCSACLIVACLMPRFLPLRLWSTSNKLNSFKGRARVVVIVPQWRQGRAVQLEGRVDESIDHGHPVSPHWYFESERSELTRRRATPAAKTHPAATSRVSLICFESFFVLAKRSFLALSTSRRLPSPPTDSVSTWPRRRRSRAFSALEPSRSPHRPSSRFRY